jgi:hypothetical protein
MNRVALLCMVLLAPAWASAQSLEARLQALAPGQWLAYDVPMQPGLRSPCCLDWKSRRDARPAACRLEDRDWNFGSSDADPVAPAGSQLHVMLRRGAEGHDRLHAVGEACAIDPGTATVVEAGAVDAATSLAFLARSLGGSKKQRDDAIVAVAYHAGDGADRLLAGAARGDDPRLRRDAAFWLAHARGEFGYRTVRGLIDQGAGDDEVNHLVFALSISPVEAAAAELRRLAREHGDAGVRGEALFWLAQGNDPQAETLLKAAVTGDPSPAVRKKAVFALSQLPPGRAVPALRGLVEHGASRAVRKEALFWLAQVDSDAVLPVFDELLGDAK